MNHAARIEDFSRDLESLTIAWSDGTRGVFPYLWLRDNCTCERCGDTSRGRRFLRLIDVPPDVAPTDVGSSSGGDVAVTWAPDGHGSVFAAAWLRQHAVPATRARPTLWDASIAEALPDHSWSAVADGGSGLLAACSALLDVGFVRLRGLGTGAADTERAVELLGPIQMTSYGRLFDIVVEAGSEILSQTGVALSPHTDEPFRYTPPGIIAFHCVRPAGEGGATVLVDGFRVADALRREAPDAFHILSTQPQPFHRRLAGAFDLRDGATPICLDAQGDVVGIRFAERSFAPLSGPPKHILAIYGARRAMLERIHDPRLQLVLPLVTGDLLLFDNHRLLHGRTAFSGARHMRQCSVAREDVHSRIRQFAERANTAVDLPVLRGALA